MLLQLGSSGTQPERLLGMVSVTQKILFVEASFRDGHSYVQDAVGLCQCL